jgi:hypothetical protein
MDIGQPSWEEMNQRYLVDALAELRMRLGAMLQERGGTLPDAAGTAGAGVHGQALQRAEEDVFGSPVAVPALERLCTIFGLTSFERAALLLCAGVELDSGFATLCASGMPPAARPSALRLRRCPSRIGAPSHQRACCGAGG